MQESKSRRAVTWSHGQSSLVIACDLLLTWCKLRLFLSHSMFSHHFLSLLLPHPLLPLPHLLLIPCCRLFLPSALPSQLLGGGSWPAVRGGHSARQVHRVHARRAQAANSGARGQVRPRISAGNHVSRTHRTPNANATSHFLDGAQSMHKEHTQQFSRFSSVLPPSRPLNTYLLPSFALSLPLPLSARRPPSTRWSRTRRRRGHTR